MYETPLCVAKDFFRIENGGGVFNTGNVLIGYELKNMKKRVVTKEIRKKGRNSKSSKPRSNRGGKWGRKRMAEVEPASPSQNDAEPSIQEVNLSSEAYNK